MTMAADNPARPWQHAGAPVSIEGVPFGVTYNDGDYYISTSPLAPDDIDMVAAFEVERAARTDAESRLADVQDLVAAVKNEVEAEKRYRRKPSLLTRIDRDDARGTRWLASAAYLGISPDDQRRPAATSVPDSRRGSDGPD
jgi:hypothetical protein